MTLFVTAQFIVNSLRLDQPIPHPPPDLDWPQLVHHADGHSLTPLLYDTWREAGVLESIPPDIRRRMAQAYHDNAQRNSYIRAELLEIQQILAKANVPYLLLKGWPLVEQLYPNPAQRVLYDHDFLVPASRAAAGHQALQAAGFKPLPGKDEWVAKHLTPLWRNDGYQWNGYLFDPFYPRPVELHLELWERGWRGLHIRPLPDPWPTARNILVAGRPMPLLSLEDTLIHLAMHFAGHLVEREARLNQLLDLARFVKREQSYLNWVEVVTRAKQARVSRFVYASLGLASQIFGAPLPPEPFWAELSAATPPPLRAWLTTHGPSDTLTADYRRREKGKDYRLTFLAATSLREKAGIIRFALLPPLEQLMVKYRFQRRWLGPFYYPRYVVERAVVYGRGAWDNFRTR